MIYLIYIVFFRVFCTYGCIQTESEYLIMRTLSAFFRMSCKSNLQDPIK